MTRVLSLAVFLWAVLTVQGQPAFACDMHADANVSESSNLHHTDTGISSYNHHYWLLQSRSENHAGPESLCHQACCAKVVAASCNHCLSSPVIQQDIRTLPAIPVPALSLDPFSEDLSPIVTAASPFAHKYRLPVYLATNRLRF